MKRAKNSIILCILLAACLQKAAQPPRQPATSSSRATSVPSSVREDLFEVEAWVDEPAPAREARVIIYGSLIKNGVRLGGIMMRAAWPDDEKEPGVPDCTVLVTYGRGVCVVDAGGFPPGELVPITVAFDFDGKLYTGQTSFTPR